MLSFSGSLTIWLAVQPCDMRKGYQGLMELVAANGGDVRSGALFVFGNRPKTRLRILYHDGTGLWLMSKRLERGTFAFPAGDEKVMRLRPEAFAMLTDGIDLRTARMRPWYQRD